MPLQVYRLRRLLAATAVLLSVVVAGMYFYARSKATNVLKQIPGKIGFDIKQTASGFQFSKSDGKRTLFTVQASNVKEFKLDGNAELHNVSIVLYGRDSSRFDQIYGDDFAYNQKTGDVTAKGDVQIDLVANPAGLASPDQTTPKELKNPIHLKTHDLVFNKDSGNAMTAARVDFETAQARGWAMGVRYVGKTNTLTLSSQIHIVLTGPDAAVIEADHGIITNEPRTVTLDHPRLTRAGGKLLADQAVFYLGRENQVDRILATGNVTTETRTESKQSAAALKPGPGPEASTHASANQPSSLESSSSEMCSRADQGEFFLEGKKNLLRTAIMTGHVHVEQSGPQSMQGDAGRAILDFAGHNQLQKIHALDGVKLTQNAVAGSDPAAKTTAAKATAAKTTTNGPQDFELTAPAIDFTVLQGHILQKAITLGAAQITIAQAGDAIPKTRPNDVAAQRTVVTAARFQAQFAASLGRNSDGRNRLSSIHGAPNARIVNSTAGEPDRISTSESVDAAFLPQGGIDSITQQGNVAYTDAGPPDKRMQAWAHSARYTPSDQMLVLTGDPRVANGGMATTATTIRINRATGDALAQGDVKSTYSELKEQPSGALLASSSPIHVTAQTMSARNNPGIALYTGNARLWQDANIIEAPSIEFDRDRRFVIARGTPAQSVRTILVQSKPVQPERVGAGNIAEKTGQVGRTVQPGSSKAGSVSPLTPVSVTAATLTYADAERCIHYEGGVLAKAADFTASAKKVDAYLLPRSQTSTNQSVAAPGQLDHLVAEDEVVIITQQPSRHAQGQKLVYTAADDKFVLTGGPPSIFDAEHGKITGVSLTFFRADDRVLVEGEASTPVVTQTRVAR